MKQPSIAGQGGPSPQPPRVSLYEPSVGLSVGRQVGRAVGAFVGRFVVGAVGALVGALVGAGVELDSQSLRHRELVGASVPHSHLLDSAQHCALVSKPALLLHGHVLSSSNLLHFLSPVFWLWASA